MMATAKMSSCGKYRYSLSRAWQPALPVLTFVMLNPSTADARKDDPTIKSCIRLAINNGFGGISVVNLFAWRATDKSELKDVEDPFGPGNSMALFERSSHPDRCPVAAAWGSLEWMPKDLREAAEGIIRRLDERHQMKAFEVTKDGHPKHPLYLLSHSKLSRFYPRVGFSMPAQPSLSRSQQERDI